MACPFVCMLAEREDVLGPESTAAAVELLERAATPAEQRGIKRYDVLHGMLCSPEHTRAAILHDIREWLEARLTRSFDAPRVGTTMRRF